MATVLVRRVYPPDSTGYFCRISSPTSTVPSLSLSTKTNHPSSQNVVVLASQLEASALLHTDTSTMRLTASLRANWSAPASCHAPVVSRLERITPSNAGTPTPSNMAAIAMVTSSSPRVNPLHKAFGTLVRISHQGS